MTLLNGTVRLAVCQLLRTPEASVGFLGRSNVSHGQDMDNMVQLPQLLKAACNPAQSRYKIVSLSLSAKQIAALPDLAGCMHASQLLHLMHGDILGDPRASAHRGAKESFMCLCCCATPS